MLKVFNFGSMFLVSTPQAARALLVFAHGRISDTTGTSPFFFLHLVDATQHGGWGGGGAC